MRKHLLLAIYLLLIDLLSWSFESINLPFIKHFDGAAIYSVAQDEAGAIWLNTNVGVYRLSEHTAEMLHSPLIMHNFCLHGKYIIAPSSQSLCYFDTERRSCREVRYQNRSFKEAPVESSGGNLYLAFADSVFKVVDDTLSYVVSTPNKEKITAIYATGAGKMLIGTSDGKCLEMKHGKLNDTVNLRYRINLFFEDSKGRIWIGLKNGRLYCMNNNLCTILFSTASYDKKPFSDVRTFSENNNGEIYFGSANGLFCISEDFSITEYPVKGISGQAICSTFHDRDQNFWVGTYYYGISFSNSDLGILNPIKLPEEMRLIKDITEDKHGTIWVATDNLGLFSFKNGEWSRIKGTTGIKYQVILYDEAKDMLLTAEYMGPLIRYSIKGTEICTEKIFFSERLDETMSISDISVSGDSLYLSTSDGIYVYNSNKEKSISRKIQGISGRVSDLQFLSDGSLLACGTGICLIKDKKVMPIDSICRNPPAISKKLVSKLNKDEDGTIWASVIGDGCYHLKNDGYTLYSEENSSLSSNYVTSFTKGKNGELIFGTRNGISILNAQKDICQHISHFPGTEKGSGNSGKLIKLNNGKLLFFGYDYIMELKQNSETADLRQCLVIDGMKVNGERRQLPESGDVIKLKHNENDFSFDICNFDFSGINKINYCYQMRGLDDSWKKFNISEPLIFMNMNPGHYTLSVKGVSYSGATLCETSRQIRIIPAWYSTILAKLLYLFGSITILLYVTLSVKNRMDLSSRLEQERQETEKKTKFFIELSYRLRTPLNIMIGQTERFFKDYGSRTAGVESIEEIFTTAKQMRTLISEYVDEQDTTSNENARFLNAATGAVERNLFKDFSVSDFCRELNIGKTGLTQKLRQITGRTPRQFIEDIRLEHAAQILLEGNMRVSEISDILMFNTPKYFTKRFKMKYGITPTDYRSKL